MSSFLCRTCGSTVKSNSYIVKEMMFSSREEFAYDQCGACDSIQIAKLLESSALSKYYPKDYYSFNADSVKSKGIRDALKTFSLTARDRGVFGRSFVGQLIERVKPEPSTVKIIHEVGVGKDQKILDVGCGAGALLNRLARLGFRNISGVDPFLSGDAVTSEGVQLRKRRLAEEEGQFDVIIFNHSFEHLPDPQGELRTARQKLGRNGLCLIQMPTPSSQARDDYGTDWAQWDAPRHLTLISRSGMSILAASCGFQLQRIIDIGQTWSLLASELYKSGVGLRGMQDTRRFSMRELAAFRRKAIKANEARRGDSVSYVLVAQ